MKKPVGRPRLKENVKQTTVYLTDEQREYLLEIGDGNATQGLRNLLERERRRGR